MKRRHAMMALGTAVIGLTGIAWAQARRLPRIAIVFSNVPGTAMAGSAPSSHIARAIVQGLAGLGWVDGRTCLLDRRSADGDPQRAGELMRDIVAARPDVIVLGGARWLLDAARPLAGPVAILTLFHDDPVESGLIASFSRPGGTLTGVATTTGVELDGKRLQLLQQASPGIARVGFLGPPHILAQYRDDKWPPGVTVVPIAIATAASIEEVLASIRRERVDSFLVASGPLTLRLLPRLIAFAEASRLPAIYSAREAVDGGGLMSYGPSITEAFGRLARMVDQVLKGTKAGDVPVERPARLELVLNQVTARKLGIEIPPALLLLADEVIE